MTASAPRLLLILTEFPPAVGGMQTHARYLTRHLVQRGCTVEVLTYRVTDERLADDARQFDAAAGYPVRRVLSRLGYWRNLDLILARIRQFRPDAVYASTVFYGLLTGHTRVPLLCRSVGNDVLRPWQGYPFPLMSGMMASPWMQRRLRWWLEHGHHPDWVDRLFRQARQRLMREAAIGHTRIFANSGYTAGLLSDIGVDPARIDVVAGGVDAAHFSAAPAVRQVARRDCRAVLGLVEDDLVLLTVCRLVAKKGVEVLLAALQSLLPTYPQLKLVVVGDGQRRRAYQMQARLLGLEGAVRFVGRVPFEQVRQYFWASDLFVLASYEAPYAGGTTRDVETMGRVLCEANAAGLPVIATRSGGIPSVVREEDNGLLVTPGDAASLASAIARIASDAGLASSLAQAGLRRARQEFDWPVVMARHEQAIEAAAGVVLTG